MNFGDNFPLDSAVQRPVKQLYGRGKLGPRNGFGAMDLGLIVQSVHMLFLGLHCEGLPGDLYRDADN